MASLYGDNDSRQIYLCCEQFALEFRAGQCQVSRDVRQNAFQRTDLQELVSRNGNVVLRAANAGCQTNVAAVLARSLIAEAMKQLLQLNTAEIARRLQALITSS